MLHICVSEWGQHWFREWLAIYSAPSHYLNQCWVMVNWTLSNKLQWKFNQNTKLFIHKNASENIVCEMATILPRGRWVNPDGIKMSSLHMCKDFPLDFDTLSQNTFVVHPMVYRRCHLNPLPICSIFDAVSYTYITVYPDAPVNVVIHSRESWHSYTSSRCHLTPYPWLIVGKNQ